MLPRASVVRDGRPNRLRCQRELPNYQVFTTSARWMGLPGSKALRVRPGGGRGQVGVLVCEDAWFATPRDTAAAGAQLLAVIADASPSTWAAGHGSAAATMRAVGRVP